MERQAEVTPEATQAVLPDTRHLLEMGQVKAQQTGGRYNAKYLG